MAGKKSSWWKKARVPGEAEDALAQKTADAIEGGSLQERPDEAIFTIDKGPVVGLPKIEKKKKKRFADLYFEGKKNSYIKPIATPPASKSVKSLEKRIAEGQTSVLKKKKAGKERQGKFKKGSVNKAWMDTVEMQKPKQKNMAGIMKSTNSNAVEIPHPGLSYYPKPEDYKDLLDLAEKEENEVFAGEAKKLKIRAKLAKVPELQSKAGAGMFSVVGMGESDEEEEEEEGDMVAEDDEGDDFGHVDATRKTGQQKRKEKRVLRETKRAMAKKAQRRFNDDIEKVNVIKKAIRKEEEAQKAIRDKKAAKPVVDKGIGKHKLTPRMRDFTLPEDMPNGKIYRIKNEFNARNDYEDSLRRRNIIPTRSNKQAQMQRRLSSNRRFRWVEKRIPEHLQEKE